MHDFDTLMMLFFTLLYHLYPISCIVPVHSFSNIASTPTHASHPIYSGVHPPNVKGDPRANLHSPLSTRINRSSASFSSSTSLASSSTAATIDNIQTTEEEVKHESHKNFDYLSHWYPVAWSRDLELDKPTKVTVFDVDYVIAKVQNKNNDEEEEVIAMIDVCPHKAAALSEGRITQFGKSFQCAYHGWTFDSKTGECIDIPQVAPVGEIDAGTRKRRSSSDLKSNGVAVPAMISQDMVWIFPGGGLEDVLSAPSPPTIPELDMDGFRFVSQVVRDFPIDWTVLLENIVSIS